MNFPDLILPVQIRQRTGQPQNPVISSCAQSERIKKPFHILLLRKPKTAENTDISRSQLRIEPDRHPFIALLLPGSRFHYLCCQLSAVTAILFSASRQSRKFHPRHLRADIHAIQNRAGNPAQVSLYLSRRTAALVPIRIISAGAGIHGRHQHKIRRIAEGSAAPGDLDPVLFHGLSEQIQRFPSEFRQLIQEQNPSVRQTDDTRTGNPAAPR